MTKGLHNLLTGTRFTAAILAAISLPLAWCLSEPVARAAAPLGIAWSPSK